MSEHRLLFVYGSLRRHATHPMSARLAKMAQWEGDAFAQGGLFRVSWYPGLVKSAEGRVRGDLYRLPSAAMLDELDVYEGIQHKPEDEYRRELAVVETATGVFVEAWVYWFIQPVEAHAWIPEGDWLTS